MELYAPDWELIFYVPIVNLSQSSKVGRIAIANNVTNENIATSVLLPTTPTKPIFPDTDSKITQLTKEGLGIRSTARVLGISVTTLLKRILQIASKIKQPPIAVGRTYEVDEMRIFIGKKSCLRWLAYALDTSIP